VTRPDSYSRLQIALHWGTVALIALNYVVSDGMGYAMRAIARGETPDGLTPVVHVYVGLGIIGLVLVRGVVRLVQGTPDVPEATPPLLRKASALTHAALYALVLAVPVLGAVAWYGQLRWMGDVHVVVMNGLLVLAGLHAAAALYHHYALKDMTLMRMLRPGASG